MRSVLLYQGKRIYVYVYVYTYKFVVCICIFIHAYTHTYVGTERVLYTLLSCQVYDFLTTTPT